MATRESLFYISDNEILKEIREDAKGGESLGGQETMPQSDMGGGGPVDRSRPCIIINPKVFSDNRDALCVAYNEAFRVVMEENGFDPVSEPTDRQRRFFADTAYAEDENMLRRTILARIATFDTSVKDPTDEQLEETMEMLEMVMEVGAPQNETEQANVQRIHDMVARLRGSPAEQSGQPEAPVDAGAVNADVGGGDTEEEEKSPSSPFEADVQARLDTQERAQQGMASGFGVEWEAQQERQAQAQQGGGLTAAKMNDYSIAMMSSRGRESAGLVKGEDGK